MSSSDDDQPVVRRPPPKKAQPVDSDDDEPVVRRPAKPAAADSDSDDDAVVRKPPAKAARKPAADDDSDDEPVVAKPARHVDPGSIDTDSDEDDAVTTAKPGRSSGPLVDLIDYDAMNTAAFLEHLKKQTKRQRMAEKKEVADRKAEAAADQDEHDCHFDGKSAYTYRAMLDRIMDICRDKNPDSSTAERIRLPMPRIERSGSKKTALTNFKELCHALGRTQDEVKDFIEKTLTVQSSVDGNNCLIMKYQNAKIHTFEKLLDKYVEEYVKCRACGKIQTDLEKEPQTRLLKIVCRNCKAHRYVQAANNATFKATTTKRSRLRAAAAAVS